MFDICTVLQIHFIITFFSLRKISDCPIQESCSDDDASCSRSAAIDGAKRKHPGASFTTEMAQSRKRRRRKKDKTLELTTDGIDVDMWKGESVHTTTQPTRPTSDGKTSTCATELDNPLQTDSASPHDIENGGTFQLFVHIEGGSEREKEPISLSEEHETKWSQHEKMKTNTKQALRGGSAHYCHKRRGRRLLKGSLSESKHHPSSSELSNCHTSITSMGAAQSNSVSKQGALFEESQDRLKGKELRQSHTPPSPAVDAGHPTSSEVTQREGSKTLREGCKTLREGSRIHREGSVEKDRHRRRVTRGSSGHRRRVMRCRKGTRIAQVGHDQSAARLNRAQPYK